MATIIIMMVDLVEHHTGIVCVAHSLTSPETIFFHERRCYCMLTLYFVYSLEIIYQMLKVCFKLYNLSAAPKPDHDGAFDDVAGECIPSIACIYLENAIRSLTAPCFQRINEV